MDDDLFLEADGPAPSDDAAAARNRRRIDRPERITLDRALAVRLDRQGANPWKSMVTDMVDIETGETFADIAPIIEHWIFAGPAKRRAAKFNALFTAFIAQADTSRFRAFVLRSPKTKAGPGDLAKTLAAVTTTYGRIMASAKRDGLANPVAVFAHPRWDGTLGLWDVHLHCIIDVAPQMEDRLFMRLAANFSTPRSIGPTRNIGAWANYSATWIVDHRDIASWSDEAVLELWSLKAPQLIRKAGAFALFARTIRGKALRWEADSVVAEDRVPRRTRQERQQHLSDGGQRAGYAVIRIGGRRPRCAVLRYDRQLPTSPPDPRHGSASRRAVESTTTPRPIPSMPTPGQPLTHQVRDVRRRVELWQKIWPYGTPGRPPRQIRRRLAQAGVVIDPKQPGRLWRRQDRP
jgi:hypothetical protein